MPLALVLIATSSLHDARLCRAYSVPLRRATPPILMAEDNDWDASWQRVIDRRQQSDIVQPDAEPRNSNPMQQVIDVRRWRLPFAWFTFMRETDMFGTLLFTTWLAWVLFYLVVVPSIYVFGPTTLGYFAITKSSGLIPVDLQRVANVVFIPAWPACLLVAAGVRLRLGNPFAVDETNDERLQ